MALPIPIMDFALRAAESAQKVYKDHINRGTIEYEFEWIYLEGEEFLKISVAGTNELLDMLSNLCLFSWKGVKLGAYLEARCIYQITKKLDNFDINRTILTGHSKGGAAVIAFKYLYGGAACYAFNPARCLRSKAAEKTMEDTLIFVDPDDPITKLGFLSFDLPACEYVYAEDDHEFLSFGDHPIARWVEFLKRRKVGGWVWYTQR